MIIVRITPFGSRYCGTGSDPWWGGVNQKARAPFGRIGFLHLIPLCGIGITPSGSRYCGTGSDPRWGGRQSKSPAPFGRLGFCILIPL